MAHSAIIVILLLLSFVNGQSPVDSGFFYCHHHGLPTAINDETVRVQLDSGDPLSYQNATVYKVAIESKVEFDFILITTVYSPMTPTPNYNKRKMCSILHSQSMQQQTTATHFLWTAPSPDLGCVHFLATLTNGDAVVVKDAWIYRICPSVDEDNERSVNEDNTIQLSGINQSDYVIFRDDFQSADRLNQLWKIKQGVDVIATCDSVRSQFASFCESTTERKRDLITTPMNLTAGLLQFTVIRRPSATACHHTIDSKPTSSAASLVISYATGDCSPSSSNWTVLRNVSLLAIDDIVEIVTLPPAAQRPETCLRWTTVATNKKTAICFGIDDVIVINTLAKKPTSLEADFDPLKIDDWLFLPAGASVHNRCDGMSRGKALVLADGQAATTRDLQLLQSGFTFSHDQVLWRPDFDSIGLSSSQHWEFGSFSATIELLMDCSSGGSHRQLILRPVTAATAACSPPLDQLASAGNLRFRLEPWSSSSHQCNSSTAATAAKKAVINKLNVWIDYGHSNVSILSQFLLNKQESSSIDVSLKTATVSSSELGRICWQLAPVDGALSSPWALLDVQLLPAIIEPVEEVLQFNLNLNCAAGCDRPSTLSAVRVEYSTDYGRHWRLLHDDVIHQQSPSWDRVILPLPTAALTQSTRFRFAHTNSSSSGCSWAIDDIHLGSCSLACSGHGTCGRNQQCVCDQGYEGQQCQTPITRLPVVLRQQFEQDDEKLESRGSVQLLDDATGSCGSVADGRAAVFKGEGAAIITTDLDTSSSSNSSIRFVYKSCSNDNSINRPLLYVHSSCNGGVTWSLLAAVEASVESRLFSKDLTALGQSCRFRIRIKDGADTWAIDDLYIGPVNDDDATVQSLDRNAFVGRHESRDYCNRTDVLVLQSNEIEETQPISIESFSVVQLELAVGCDDAIKNNTNSHLAVVIQYSIDGGLRWINLEASRRHVSELSTGRWRRIGIRQLPPESWSQSTRFRVAQTAIEAKDRRVLAVDHFYAGSGANCPQLCRLNGRCKANIGCVCDEGFQGPDCLPTNSEDRPIAAFIAGGRLVSTDPDGCLIRGASNLLFDANGIRLLETKEVMAGAVIYFFLRLGHCDATEDEEEPVQVDVQLSWNGGLDWRPLREYRSPFYSIPQLERIVLTDAPSPTAFAKIRFAQPGVHGQHRNVWSVSGLSVSDDFWLVQNVPNPSSSTYCLVFDAHCPSRIRWYGALTKEMQLKTNDVIEFQLSTPVTDERNQQQHLVQVEYSTDGGSEWHLVRSDSITTQQQPSRIDYRSISSIDAQVFHYPVTDAMANGPMLLRWVYLRSESVYPVIGFEIKDLYIGPACPSHCSGHGRCTPGPLCTCYSDFNGDDCSNRITPLSVGFYDTFPSQSVMNSNWNRLIGGRVTPNHCRSDDETDGALFFDGDGPRSIQTNEIDARNLKMVLFTLGVVQFPIYDRINCQRHHRLADYTKSFLILDFTLDNGLNWQLIESWPMDQPTDGSKRLGVLLPTVAKSPSTVFRWWQNDYADLSINQKRLKWYLDDVLVNVNDTNPTTFEYEMFDSVDEWMMQRDEPQLDRQDEEILQLGEETISHWMGWNGLVHDNPSATSPDGSNALAYAETWDMDVGESTFAQFQLMSASSAEIRFEFSTDMGRHWQLVESQPEHQPVSVYSVTAAVNKSNATRITVHLPKQAITRSTRFRWISSLSSASAIWGIGHVYIGGTCPWMCSGHGTCHLGRCSCDQGYGGSDCVSIEPLPRNLIESFDDAYSSSIIGANVSSSCGVIASGTAAVFHQDGVRMLQTIDLDLTSASYAQMMVKFYCDDHQERRNENNRLLLQYSVNGGITWHLIQEVLPPTSDEQHQQLVVANLMRIEQLTNCTRLRLWQPFHSGEGHDTWAVDGLVVFSILAYEEAIQYQEQDQQSSAWLSSFGADETNQIFCSKEKAFVFNGQFGENQVFTRDALISSEFILQFEVNVGCGMDSELFPIRLEYSTDGGSEWKLVVTDDDHEKINPHDRAPHQTTSIYYTSTHGRWARETVLLSHLDTNRAIRFRWSQGYLNVTERQIAPHWALRNVFLGPQCPDLCNGRGQCRPMAVCLCDDDYKGDSCQHLTGDSALVHPRDFQESFIASEDADGSGWRRISGGERVSDSPFGVGGRLVMNHAPVRLLETADLDLTNANFVQFHIESLLSADEEDSIIFLDYSINGGIEWITFHHVPLSTAVGGRLDQVNLPSRSLSWATRLRWSDKQKLIRSLWAIDEIYIGGEHYAKLSIESDMMDVNNVKDHWLFVSGAKLEPSCTTEGVTTLHFVSSTEMKSWAMTKDVKINDQSYLQYQLSIGCTDNIINGCKRIGLEYSGNYGLTWTSLTEGSTDCLPVIDRTDCIKYSLHSELLSRQAGYQRLVTIPLHLIGSRLVRFRWTGGDKQSTDDELDWSIQWLYIGADCADGCNGRGRCSKGSCQCEPDWSGERCEISSFKLSSSIREPFTDKWADSVWSTVRGASVSSFCGSLESGTSLHFHGNCDRYAETRELDLSDVRVVQFHLKSGCSTAPSSDSIILFQYSSNGGITWHTGLQLNLKEYRNIAKLISYVVPIEARRSAVKLRWTQLAIATTNEPIEDWAIDSLTIDSPLNLITSSSFIVATNKTELVDVGYLMDEPINNSHSVASSSHSLHYKFGSRLWWRTVNAKPIVSFCGQSGNDIDDVILRAKSNSDEDSILETSDFLLSDGDTHQQKLGMSFDLIIGSCTVGESVAKVPIRLEVSLDHGLSWKMFHPLKLRGQSGGTGPQSPSLFYETGNQWQNYRFSLQVLQGVKLARLRWRHPKSADPITWTLKNFIIAPIADHLNSCASSRSILKDEFNDNKFNKKLWNYFYGGTTVPPAVKLGDGSAIIFRQSGLRLLQTVAIDLSLAKAVQLIIHFPNERKNKGLPSSVQHHADWSTNNVYLQCSIDGGFTWILLQEYHQRLYERPSMTNTPIPSECRSSCSILRWWQPLMMETNNKVSTAVISTWIIDNFAIDQPQLGLNYIYDSFSDGIMNSTQWQWHPNGAVSKQLCSDDDADYSLNFVSSNGGGTVGLTSQFLPVHRDFAAYFKIRTGCSRPSCPQTNDPIIRFEMKHGFDGDWSLVKPNCLPSSVNDYCKPQVFHSSSAYSFNSINTWQRFVIPITSTGPVSNWRQFRWIVHNDIGQQGTKNRWGLKDVYIGLKCPWHCYGRGDCIRGKCYCDVGFEGTACTPISSRYVVPLLDNFDDNQHSSHSMWQSVNGSTIGAGCGSLIPVAHGRHLHFDGCGTRMALTKFFDTKKIRRIGFVLRSGTPQQLITCRTQSAFAGGKGVPPSVDRSILLQYSFDGVDWMLLGSHNQNHYLQPLRVVYNVPVLRNSSAVCFRWWQPSHGGKTWDQWALDNVELMA